MARIASDTEDLCICNQEVEEIVRAMKSIQCNACMTTQEKHDETCTLLTEMREYTQPLIEQIDALSETNKHLVLHRIARLFPETVQKEIKQCQIQHTEIEKEEGSALLNESDAQLEINEHLKGLGWTDLNTLANSFDFDQSSFAQQRQRRRSEKQTTNHVEKKLNQWKKQRELNEAETMQKLKEDKKNKKRGPNVNNRSEKVMLMMGIHNAESQEDFEVIFNASAKARSKFL